MRKTLLELLIFIACCVGVFAQSTSGKQTPQEEWKAYQAQSALFREQVTAAFDREMARQKAGDCREATTTYAIGECLAKETETTTMNYKEYTGALRSLLGLVYPGGETLAQGPSGKPLTSKELVKEFDTAEAAWQQYREAICRAAADQFLGGTIFYLEGGYCQLMLVRSHMRELDTIYNMRLHH
jgi:uncharacterized protein YecT (DUF1311 family)